MKQYHKIINVWNRDPNDKHRTLIENSWATEDFAYLANNEWTCTEKVDGTNIRVIIDNDGSVEFRGKTDNAQIPPMLVKALEEKFPKEITEKIRDTFGFGVTLYGEGYGAKIQKGGGNYRSDQGFVLFDINVDGIWLRRHAILDIAHSFNIGFVPIIKSCTLHEAIEIARKGFDSRWGDFPAEGLICKPSVEMNNRLGQRIITKIKTKDFKC